MSVRKLVGCIAIALGSLAVMAPPTVTAAVNQCDPPWTIVPSPDGGRTGNGLYGVAAAGANDVWAVGTYFSDQQQKARSLIEHWDGTAWTVVGHPEFGQDSFLLDVDAVTPTDIWAVGYYHTVEFQKTFALHWDGSTWTVVPTVDQGLESSVWGIEAVTSTDVWAVGTATSPDGSRTRPLIEHWDGTEWSVVTAADPGGRSSGLVSVSAASDHDVWAVGDRVVGQLQHRTLVEHWDGSEWIIVRSPDPSPMGDELMDVLAVGTNDVWAVGSMTIRSGQDARLIEHWNGESWRVVGSPSLPGSTLEGIGGVASDDLWAVGTHGDLSLTERWNGARWIQVDSPSVGLWTTLHEVAAVAPNDVWAVGSQLANDGRVHTFVMHHCG
jgi:hypothetical protein